MSSVEHARMSSSSSCDESPSTKTNNATNNKHGKRVSEAASGSRFAGSGVDFKGKLIGVEDVAESRGDKICQVAMAKLKAGVKASKEHKQRIIINVSLEGIKIIDDKSAEVLHVHEVNRISFISRDTGDSRAFGYVYRRQDALYQFVAIKTEKAAESLVLSLRDLFQVAFDLKKRQEAETCSDDAGDAGTEAGDNKTESQDNQVTAKSEETATAENLLNLEVEFQNLSKASAPQISPIWTTVDPWKPTVQPQQPAVVGVSGYPVMGVYPGPTMMMMTSPYGLGATVGPSSFTSSPWPQSPQTQATHGVDYFATSPTATALTTPLSPPSHRNGTVPGSSDTPLIPARSSPSLGNPFVTSTSSQPADPFAKLASGLMNATPQSHQPRRKTDKSEFFQETSKPTLLHLSTQQQQQTQCVGGQLEQPANVDLFGATPFSAALTEGAADPFA